MSDLVPTLAIEPETIKERLEGRLAEALYDVLTPEEKTRLITAALDKFANGQVLTERKQGSFNHETRSYDSFVHVLTDDKGRPARGVSEIDKMVAAEATRQIEPLIKAAVARWLIGDGAEGSEGEVQRSIDKLVQGRAGDIASMFFSNLIERSLDKSLGELHTGLNELREAIEQGIVRRIQP